MKRFSIVQNGYDIDEVNRFIDIVIRRLEKLDQENSNNLAQIESLKKKLDEKPSVSNNNADISKARKMLGYDPLWSFERGIKEAIAWYRENL